MTSLKRQLIRWLVGLLTVISILTAGLSFFLELSEINKLQDIQLQHIARSVDEGSQLAAMRNRFVREDTQEQAQDFVIQVWMNGLPVRTSRPDFNLPHAIKPKFSSQTLTSGSHTSIWRTYTLFYPNRIVQVAQSEAVRLNIATHAALRALLPNLLLIPISWVMIGLIVSQLLKPLESVTEAASHRQLNSLDPLPADNLPIEVAPLIASINDLVSRLSQALSAQRQFLSDAAHELRTPLAALTLQIDGLAYCTNKAQLDARINDMRSGAQRASHMVAQLLKISRYEAQHQAIQRTKIDINACIKSLIADMIPLADQRRIDLGLVQNDPACVHSNSEDLRILFSNLLDNAIRYTAEEGKVDIYIARNEQHVCITVMDTGPGIDQQSLLRVYDRFFRAAGQDTDGSGIGLSIVKAIADRESAHIQLRNRTDCTGLIAEVTFARCDA